MSDAYIALASATTGRPANLHAQMAHSQAVLTAYTSLRAVLAKQSTFRPHERLRQRAGHRPTDGHPDERRQNPRADRRGQGSTCQFAKRYRRHLDGRSASRLEQLTDAFAHLGRRFSRDISSTTRKPIWMACGRSNGAHPAAPRESSLDLVIAGISLCHGAASVVRC